MTFFASSSRSSNRLLRSIPPFFLLGLSPAANCPLRLRADFFGVPFMDGVVRAILARFGEVLSNVLIEHSDCTASADELGDDLSDMLGEHATFTSSLPPATKGTLIPDTASSASTIISLFVRDVVRIWKIGL